jgi:RNA polymerase sigma-70 factor (ECF subfamily)
VSEPAHPPALRIDRLQAVNPRDEDAWTEFYRRFWPFVFAVAYRALKGDPEAARDVAQEAFLRFLRRAPLATLTNEAMLKSYLYRTAENCAIDHVRTKRSRGREVPGVDLDQYPDVTGAISDRADLLRTASEALLPIDRQILTMALDGHSVRDVSSATGLSTANVYVRMHRMRKRLRKLLGPASPEPGT